MKTTKHSKEQILEKARQVMKDLRTQYYSDTCVDDAIFTADKVLFSGAHEDKTLPVWTVTINSLFDNLDFLHISDETNEPLCYQNFNTLTFDIQKNTEGKYYRVE